MSERDEIERLEREIQRRKQGLANKQANCSHDWSEPKYDPETYNDYCFSHYEGHGSDPTPIYNTVKKQRDRWSRYCPKCEKKEYTYEQKPVKYAPNFK